MHCSGSLVSKLEGKSGECVLEQTALLMVQKEEDEEEEGPRAPQSLRSTPPKPTEPTKLYPLRTPPLPNGAVWGSGC